MANFCENCGSPLQNDNKLCPSCGAPVKHPEQDIPAAASAATPVNEGTLASAAAAGTAAAAVATGKMQDAFVAAQPQQEPVRPTIEQPKEPGQPTQQQDSPQSPKESSFEQQEQNVPFTNRMPMENRVQGEAGSKYEPDTNLISMFLRYDNRLNRKRYFMRLLVLWVIKIAIVITMAILYNTYKNTAFIFLGAIIVIAAFIVNLLLKIRRLHDLNRSGWWILVVFAPVAHFLFFVFLLFWKGTEGPNQYGPDPLEVQD
ncbi:MAG: DUF805 domain-containing protein [Acidaminococcaceae bacterium]|nr:DUF805 domain-containing protein [Acidaminococcaceae bacterium]